MDEIIVAGEPCLVIRSHLTPRTLLCNSLLPPLLSRLKSPEEFVAFVSEPCVASQGLDVVLVKPFWPRYNFDKDSKDAMSRPVQTIEPQNLMLIESELYTKLTKKSCLFGDFLDYLFLHNEDKRRVSELLSNARSWIRDNKLYGLFFMTEGKGMEDFTNQAIGIFEIVVRAEVETKGDEPLLRLIIMKHPNITVIDKRIEVVFEDGRPKPRRT